MTWDRINTWAEAHPALMAVLFVAALVLPGALIGGNP